MEEMIKRDQILTDARKPIPKALCKKKKLRDGLRVSRYGGNKYETEAAAAEAFIEDIDCAIQYQLDRRRICLTALAALGGAVSLIDLLVRWLS